MEVIPSRRYAESLADHDQLNPSPATRARMSVPAAAQAAVIGGRWWYRVAKLVQVGLTTRYYDQIGVPRLVD
jgi:hypothetical protein